jgi:hypothetical protein
MGSLSSAMWVVLEVPLHLLHFEAVALFFLTAMFLFLQLVIEALDA